MRTLLILLLFFLGGCTSSPPNYKDKNSVNLEKKKPAVQSENISKFIQIFYASIMNNMRFEPNVSGYIKIEVIITREGKVESLKVISFDGNEQLLKSVRQALLEGATPSANYLSEEEFKAVRVMNIEIQQ